MVLASQPLLTSRGWELFQSSLLLLPRVMPKPPGFITEQPDWRCLLGGQGNTSIWKMRDLDQTIWKPIPRTPTFLSLQRIKLPTLAIIGKMPGWMSSPNSVYTQCGAPCFQTLGPFLSACNKPEKLSFSQGGHSHMTELWTKKPGKTARDYEGVSSHRMFYCHLWNFFPTGMGNGFDLLASFSQWQPNSLDACRSHW